MGDSFASSLRNRRGPSNLTGYVENSTDMVGIVDTGKGELQVNPLAFTAEHRAPYKSSPFGTKGKPKGS